MIDSRRCTMCRGTGKLAKVVNGGVKAIVCPCQWDVPAPTETIELTVPMPPTLANASGASRHYRSVAALRKEYIDSLTVRLQAKLIAPPPRRPFDRAGMRVVMYLGNRMDDDNAVIRCKPIADFLKAAGYIIDDRQPYLRWLAFPEQVIRRGQDYRVTVTLTPDAP